MRTIAKFGLLALVCTVGSRTSADQQMAGSTVEHTWTGTLTGVNAQNNAITGKSFLATRTFQIGDHCVISTLDKKTAALSDLQPGEKVKITYQNAEGVLVADRITEQALCYDGRVQAVDQKAGTMMIESKVVFRSFPVHKTFSIAPDCKVILPNGREGTLADVKPGDRIALIYELPGGSPVAYQIRENNLTMVGKLEALDLTERVAKASQTFGQKKLNLADHCQVVLAGREKAGLQDLRLGQKYQFTFQEVNGVNVVDRIAQVPEPKASETASTR